MFRLTLIEVLNSNSIILILIRPGESLPQVEWKKKLVYSVNSVDAVECRIIFFF
jgi:hypothetical protein